MSHTPKAFRLPSRLASWALRKRARRLVPLAFLAAAAVLVSGGPVRAVDDSQHQGHHVSMLMTDEAMKAHAEAYWAAHEPVGASPEAPEAPAATFTVSNYSFDNGSPEQVDTARIVIGESVLWQWNLGIHTVTSGEDSFDPKAGNLFSQPMDSAHPQFTFTYTKAGIFPFFCAFHELQNMKGVVVVSAPTGVGSPSEGAALGFTRDPAPNPTRSGVGFQYALRTAGRARAEVFDAGGRRVALLFDRSLPAGSFSASWNGRTPAGLADTGVYYVRLRLPGFEDSRRIVLRR